MKHLVLIVEDEYGSAEVLQLLLEAEGYRVASAPNGRAALDLLANESPALILSDFMMPIMNGGELGDAVRRNPALSRVPFVITSATDEEIVRRTFRDYDAFMTKPFAVEPLLALVERLVTHGRPSPPNHEAIGESMRHLMRGIDIPGRSE